MKNLMEYNGYKGIVAFSAEDQVFFGKVFGINDLVTFEGDSVKALEKAFREAVDDYIQTCREEGKETQRAYKGSFNVRIDPDIHRMAAFKAQTLNISLNEFVEQAIAKEFEPLRALYVGKTESDMASAEFAVQEKDERYVRDKGVEVRKKSKGSKPLSKKKK